VGKNPTQNYIKKGAWKEAIAQKGTVKSVLLCPRTEPSPSPTTDWKEGDTALLIHVYGGIGGKKAEAATQGPIYFGHFAYGKAQVVREPLADELMFDLEYYQVYTHNSEGLIAGKLAWNRYLGDRQFGWLGTRPIVDLLVKWDVFTQPYNLPTTQYSALDILLDQLETMVARYRIGDGTGGTYVGPAHNCSQDSNQAFYSAIQRVDNALKADPELRNWILQAPVQAQRLYQLRKLDTTIRHTLLPFGSARSDWEHGENNLGISPEQNPWEQLWIGIRSWRTLLPRLASQAIATQFLKQGASIWVLRTSQIGGDDPDIAPVAPTRIG
ncbi:MAG: CAAX protease, partial [Leptolyngbyaceae bacterium]|nr:CAAX protease [Leptolyngbyaceae bacterium]